MKKILIPVALVLLMTSFGQAQDRGRRGGGGFDPAQMIERMFEQDANSDGKLSADELGERGERMLQRADADQDGFVTKDEMKKMMESRGGRGGRGEGGRGGPGGAEGRGGPGGGPDPGRLLAMMPIMKALDADGNGQLSKKEIENAVKAIQSLDKDKNGTVSTEELMPDMSQLQGGRGAGGRGGRGGGRERGAPQRPEIDDDK